MRNRQSLEESAPRDLDLAVVLQPANCTERKPDGRQFGRSRSTDDCMQVKLSDVSLWPKDACGDGKVGQMDLFSTVVGVAVIGPAAVFGGRFSGILHVLSSSGSDGLKRRCVVG